MILYTGMIPFLVLVALLGSGYIAYSFRQIGRPVIVGATLGGLAGVGGALLFMLPLEGCTFDPEADQIDYYFGIFLLIAGAILVIAGVNWLARFILSSNRRMLLPQRTQGVFNLPFFAPLLLLAPTLVILTVFIYYPAIETFRLSTLLARLGAPRTPFVCTRNFTKLMEPSLSPMFFGLFAGVIVIGAGLFYLRRQGEMRSDWYRRLSKLFGLGLLALTYVFLMDLWEEDYGEVFFTTIFMSAMIVILGLILALGIAYLAYQPVKGAGIYRTLLIWPYAISPPIAGILFAVMFDPTAGIVDHLLDTAVGTGLPNFRQNEWLARWVIILASVWKTLGYNILFYIAGLQNVSNDLVEAAAIDGANAWQRFMNIIVPALSPITFFLIITNLTYAFFDTFGTIDYMTKGAPAGATSNAIYEIYRVGIQQRQLGVSAAQSLILFVMVIAVTVWQFRTSGRRVTYGA